MDKKIWTKPEVSVVEFEANEYVAACAPDSSLTYSATCWDPTVDFYNGSTFVLFGDSNASGTLEFSYNENDGRYDFEDPLYSDSTASSILETYGAGNSSLLGDYAIFNSVMFSDEPHTYQVTGYGGLSSNESHSFNASDYNALYNGFVLSHADASTGNSTAATAVKYMFDSVASKFHLFKLASFTSKNMMS